MAYYGWLLEFMRMPLRLGRFPGAVWVTSLRLRPNSVRMELSVIILTLVEVLVFETTKLYKVELMVVSVFVAVDFHVVTLVDLLLDVLVHL